MSIKSILVVTDLSAREHIAVERACQLADTHRASIKLMYLPQPGQDKAPAAAARLADAARQLEQDFELRVRTSPVKTGRLEDLVVAEARGMDLVVLPHRRERSTAAFFRGQPVLRLLRRCNSPVLVVRQAQGGRYARLLVAVDLSEISVDLVKLAAGFDASAQLEVFHAIGTAEEARLRSAEAPAHAVRAYRAKRLKHAQDRIVALTDSFDARRNRVLTAIGRGDAGRQVVVQQEHAGADLVVLGSRRRTAWEDFFSSSVAHRVLSWGSSDVLVVPQEFLRATAPIAARRIGGRSGQPALSMRAAQGRMS